MKTPILFISHSSKDKPIVDEFVHFMVSVGLPEESIRCSSTPGTQIRTGADLYEDIREILDRENTFVLFFISKNFYSSAVCLNEMGAAWVKQLEWRYVLLPGFSFSQVEGVIKQKESVGMSLFPINTMTKERFYDFKTDIEKLFSLNIRANVWERARDKFFEKVGEFTDSENRSLNMKNVKGYCIDDLETDGCRIKKRDSSETKATAVIDFSLTDTKLCSVVFFVEQTNWISFFNEGKHLCFDIFSDSQILRAEIEVHLKGRNETYDILISDDVKSYQIPLSQFSSSPDAWKETTEIAFLFHRKDITAPVEIVIENLHLSK